MPLPSFIPHSVLQITGLSLKGKHFQTAQPQVMSLSPESGCEVGQSSPQAQTRPKNETKVLGVMVTHVLGMLAPQPGIESIVEACMCRGCTASAWSHQFPSHPVSPCGRVPRPCRAFLTAVPLLPHLQGDLQEKSLEHLRQSDRSSLLSEIQALRAQLRLTHLQNQEKLQQLCAALTSAEARGSRQEHQLRRQGGCTPEKRAHLRFTWWVRWHAG